MAFQSVERARRKINQKDSGGEKVFVSHCWRDSKTQYKKRRLIAHMSTPKAVRPLAPHLLLFLPP